MERFVTFARDSEIIERFLAINIDKIQADAQYDFEFKQKIQPSSNDQAKIKIEPIKKKGKFNNVAHKVKKTRKVTKFIKEEKDKRKQSGDRSDNSDSEQIEKTAEEKAKEIEERVKQFLQTDDDGFGLSREPPKQDDDEPPQPLREDVIIQEIKRKKKRRRSKYEEMFTDKDRAAAVNLGSKDIKQSLKIKRKMDRSSMLHIPDEAEPSTFIALGNYEMLKGSYKIALNFMKKALELNPAEKDALVARSKCYILMGQPDDGLRDAEAALTLDKNCMKATYQKAESLYYLGDFEHSLMYYHRGLRHRPDHDGFKLGVQKAQKAIENVIGVQLSKQSRGCSNSGSSSRKTNNNNNRKTNSGGSRLSTSRIRTDRTTPEDTMTIQTKSDVKERISRTSIRSCTSNKNNDNNNSMTGRAKSSSYSNTKKINNNGNQKRKNNNNNRLLRELAPDKEYLNNLLTNPNIECKYKENNDDIINCIKEAVNFLNTREEFWRQQLPVHMK